MRHQEPAVVPAGRVELQPRGGAAHPPLHPSERHEPVGADLLCHVRGRQVRKIHHQLLSAKPLGNKAVQAAAYLCPSAFSEEVGKGGCLSLDGLPNPHPSLACFTYSHTKPVAGYLE
jgi:hypothetical protein